MRIRNQVISAALTLLAVAASPSIVHAEDDNVYDGKSYPGAMCDSAVSTVASVRTGSFYLNTSGAAAAVNCPVIQDSWLQTTGLAFSQLYFYNPTAGVTFSCTETAYDAVGGFLSSRSFSSTAAGSQAQLFYSGTYVPTTGNFGYIMIQCNVPAGGRIVGYQVQEKA